jgi:hypothetical protein
MHIESSRVQRVNCCTHCLIGPIESSRVQRVNCCTHCLIGPIESSRVQRVNCCTHCLIGPNEHVIDLNNLHVMIVTCQTVHFACWVT